MYDSKRISVAVCTYNGAQYIQEQLESILQQTIVPDEIILVDDGSTDGTTDIARKVLSESGISYEILINEQKLGVSANFAKAISHCTGDTIFTADQDDVWKSNKVEIILQKFQQDDDIALVFTNAELVDKNLQSLGIDLWSSYFFDLSQFNDHDVDYLLKKDYITGATMAFRSFDWDSIFPVPEGLYHDQWIGLNALRFGRVVCLNDQLILYRQHGNNVIGAKKTSIWNRFLIYKDNIRKSSELKEASLYRLRKLAERAEGDGHSDFMDKLENYIRFFEESIRVCEGKKAAGIKWIIRHRNDYATYWIGKAGVVRDILYVVIRKRK